MSTSERYVWTYQHGIRAVEFGPYATEHEAASRFQWKYGYWPQAPVAVREWK